MIIFRSVHPILPKKHILYAFALLFSKRKKNLINIKKKSIMLKSRNVNIVILRVNIPNTLTHTEKNANSKMFKNVQLVIIKIHPNIDYMIMSEKSMESTREPALLENFSRKEISKRNHQPRPHHLVSIFSLQLIHFITPHIVIHIYDSHINSNCCSHIDIIVVYIVKT